MVRSRKAKPPLTRTRIHTSMNELEIHLTERTSDFPLLAQFFFKQREPPLADQLLDTLAEILNDVATSSLPLFANLAKRMLTDLCRLRSVGTLNNIIDHVGRKFRMEPGTLQSRCKTQRIALGRSPTTSAVPSPAVVFRPSERRSGGTTAASFTVLISCSYVASTRPPSD